MILSGLSVVAVSGSSASAWAAKHFADWGADVTLLEPAGGSWARHLPPHYEHDGERRSASWDWLSLGTRIASGLTDEQARTACLAADVVLLDADAVQPVLGLRPEEVRAAFDSRTTCVLVSSFAPTGPYSSYRASDFGIAALGGWVSATGRVDDRPIRPAGASGYVYRISGLGAFIAALAALRAAEQGAPKQHVDLSMQAIAVAMHVPRWMVLSMQGAVQNRQRYEFPFAPQQASDGYVAVPPLTAAQWESLLLMLDAGELLANPKIMDVEWRRAHEGELAARFAGWFAKRDKDAIFREAQARRLPSAPLNTVADRLHCDQLEARGFYDRVEIDSRSVKVPRVPYLIAGAEPAHRGPAVDGVRADELMLASAGHASQPRPQDAAAGSRPLEGVRIIDFTHFWAGPSATMLLGALGADVIKVESTSRPDAFRMGGAPAGAPYFWELGPLWNDTNFNKRDITLDLASDRGRELCERLIRGADVVINNFSPNVLANLGMSAERLLQLNSRLLFVAMPGYGRGGPFEDFVGWGTSFEYMSASASLNDYEGGAGRETLACDPLVGYHAVAAILLALRAREQSGRGAAVEVAQTEQIDSIFAPEWIAVQQGAPVPSPMGNKHPWKAPHEVFRTSEGDDRWIAVAVGSDDEFQQLASELGAEELARDERFRGVEARKQHEAELDRLLEPLIAQRAQRDLEEALQRRGVEACRVVLSSELPQDEGLRHIEHFERWTRPHAGDNPARRPPFTFSTIPTSNTRRPPTLGEHTAEVLAELLQLTAAEIEELERLGVTGTVPAGWESLAKTS